MQAAAEGRGFDHLAQRIRDERERESIKAEAEAALTEQGVTVTELPTYGAGEDDEYPKREALHSLVNADDRSEVDPQDHDTCKGHAAAVRVVPTFDDEVKYRAQVLYLCTDPKQYGHVDRFAASSGKKPADQMTEEEREQAKAERREVIDNNKAWTSAETVRREWVADFLTRKTAPKDTAPFLATALAGGARGAEVAHYKVPQMLTTLGVDATPEAVEKASQSRALVLVLARVLAAYEAQTDRNDWRHPRRSTSDYLTFLAAHGYDLSEVEQRAAATN